jgi:hypothetical protein
MKIECRLAAFCAGGRHLTTEPIASCEPLTGERWPLESQPDSVTGGREPLVSGGGSGTMRPSTRRASGTPSALAHPDSRAR